MSLAPRPYSLPSRWVGTKGSLSHCARGPVGTTSVCPANTSNGAGRPVTKDGAVYFAHKLSTCASSGPPTNRSQMKPKRLELVHQQILAACVIWRDRWLADKGFCESEGFVHTVDPVRGRAIERRCLVAQQIVQAGFRARLCIHALHDDRAIQTVLAVG